MGYKFNPFTGNFDRVDGPHAQYALLAGRSGGQTLIGGIDAGDGLHLQSTAHATKGEIFFGSNFVYDEVNNRMGFGINTPETPLHIVAPLGDTVNDIPFRFDRNSNDTDGAVSFARGVCISSGDMIDGFGGFIRFEIQDNDDVPNLIARFGAVRDGADNSGKLIFRTSLAGSESDVMVINPAGDVGMGINLPLSRLHVKDTDARFILDDDGGSQVAFISRSGRLDIGKHGVSTAITIDVENELVGINELTPDAMLEIVTNNSTEEGLKIKGSASQTADLFIATDSSDNIGFQVQADFTVKNLGGRVINITEVTTSTYTVLSTDYHISIQYTDTGTQTTTLPALSATNHGQVYHFKDADYNANANNITIATIGADIIDESATAVIKNSGACITVIGNNTTKNWEIQ